MVRCSEEIHIGDFDSEDKIEDFTGWSGVSEVCTSEYFPEDVFLGAKMKLNVGWSGDGQLCTPEDRRMLVQNVSEVEVQVLHMPDGPVLVVMQTGGSSNACLERSRS